MTVILALETCLPIVSVTVQVYVPLSWTCRGLMMSLEAFNLPKRVEGVKKYLSPGISLGPLHLAVTTTSLVILKRIVAVHVRVSPVPTCRGVV